MKVMKFHVMALPVSAIILLAMISNPCVGRDKAGILPTALPASHIYLQQSDADNTMDGHVAQEDIASGKWRPAQLVEAGKRLFIAQFTVADGAGRPGATGDSTPTRRPLESGPQFARVAGPDANACVACHSMPVIGGAGGFSANVFAGQGAVHPQLFSTNPNLVAERGSPEIQGAGFIELLAREMTVELHGIRDTARKVAKERGETVRLPLITKGISFGFVSAKNTGELDLTEISGVDRDMVVRPWGQKGSVTSLRTFSVNAANLHHGMQAAERFGRHLTGTDDFDRDGITNELTQGDITALVLFQATLGVPGRVFPYDSHQRQQISLGERLFAASKCALCHVPTLSLNHTQFAEPGPYNLEGTLRQKDVPKVFTVDLNHVGPGPKPTPDGTGRVDVRLYSDLKRHVVSDPERPHFGNEVLVEGLIPTDQFITRRLWAVGNTAPYGHRGDLLSIRDAIYHHGGEAREARLEFESKPKAEQDAIVSFLRSMQILPEDSTLSRMESKKMALPYR